ncbi:hypothetical protein BDP27DRAFT_1371191 [Rhodocollybia butyracea]|uniref:Uncharacterized protein n=1 Tax=Rhodocollybia butyracea TaxID=206335 RepID=A0A9P5PAS7_9AGAR|nr:hypothetical protein BDP27DRAFT_1371191 [Rhodocollybia butyracea]
MDSCEELPDLNQCSSLRNSVTNISPEIASSEEKAGDKLPTNTWSTAVPPTLEGSSGAGMSGQLKLCRNGTAEAIPARREPKKAIMRVHRAIGTRRKSQEREVGLTRTCKTPMPKESMKRYLQNSQETLILKTLAVFRSCGTDVKEECTHIGAPPKTTTLQYSVRMSPLRNVCFRAGAWIREKRAVVIIPNAPENRLIPSDLRAVETWRNALDQDFEDESAPAFGICKDPQKLARRHCWFKATARDKSANLRIFALGRSTLADLFPLSGVPAQGLVALTLYPKGVILAEVALCFRVLSGATSALQTTIALLGITLPSNETLRCKVQDAVLVAFSFADLWTKDCFFKVGVVRRRGHFLSVVTLSPTSFANDRVYQMGWKKTGTAYSLMERHNHAFGIGQAASQPQARAHFSAYNSGTTNLLDAKSYQRVASYQCSDIVRVPLAYAHTQKHSTAFSIEDANSPECLPRGSIQLLHNVSTFKHCDQLNGTFGWCQDEMDPSSC